MPEKWYGQSHNHMNLDNFGVIAGRLARDPHFNENSDGSHKVRITVATRDNFKTKGEYGAQFVPLEAYIPKDSKMLDFYKDLSKGSPITASTSIRTPEPYLDRNGEKVYPLVIRIESIKHNGPRKTNVQSLEDEFENMEQ